MDTIMGNEFTADIEIMDDRVQVSVHCDHRDSDAKLYDLRDLLLKKGIEAEIDDTDSHWKELNFKI